MSTVTKIQTPVRFRSAREDASIKTITARIEADYGLLTGSFRIVRPDGRKVRDDATVRYLRSIWDA